MLAKTYRLKLKKDFDKIFKQGKFVSLKFFTLGFLENTLLFSRFAIIVPKKIAKLAVTRNSIKRKTTEIIRLNLEKIKIGYNIVFIAKPTIKRKNYQDLSDDIRHLLEKAGLIKKNL